MLLVLYRSHRMITVSGGVPHPMRSKMLHSVLQKIKGALRSRPSVCEFETAYQVRVAIDRIKFAIRHAEHFASPCARVREANFQLLDALDRLESLDRRFQVRSDTAGDRNGNGAVNPERN